MAKVQFFKTEQFLWLDKTGQGVTRGTTVCHYILHRAQRILAIAAIVSDGLDR